MRRLHSTGDEQFFMILRPTPKLTRPVRPLELDSDIQQSRHMFLCDVLWIASTPEPTQSSVDEERVRNESLWYRCCVYSVKSSLLTEVRGGWRRPLRGRGRISVRIGRSGQCRCETFPPSWRHASRGNLAGENFEHNMTNICDCFGGIDGDGISISDSSHGDVGSESEESSAEALALPSTALLLVHLKMGRSRFLVKFIDEYTGSAL